MREGKGRVGLWVGRAGVLVCLFVLCSTQSRAAISWRVDSANSRVGFSIPHLVISRVSGSFETFSGALVSKDGDLVGARIEATVEVPSLDTGHAGRDGHLMGDEFFAAERFPQMRYVGTVTERVGPEEYRVEGELTMRGVTRPLSLVARDGGRIEAFGATRAAFRLSGRLDRFDFGLRWNDLLETGEAMVGREVTLQLDVELVLEGNPQE